PLRAGGPVREPAAGHAHGLHGPAARDGQARGHGQTARADPRRADERRRARRPVRVLVLQLPLVPAGLRAVGRRERGGGGHADDAGAPFVGVGAPAWRLPRPWSRRERLPPPLGAENPTELVRGAARYPSSAAGAASGRSDAQIRWRWASVCARRSAMVALTSRSTGSARESRKLGTAQ